MKKFRSLLLLLLVVFVSFKVLALELPARPAGHVNDYAGLLSTTARTELERELTQFEAAESTQIVVVTLPSLDGGSIEDIGIRLADSWKIGVAGRDNGAILLVAPQERQVRIETGYGLEEKLTDAVASQIIARDMTPHFRSGRFDQGILAGVRAIQGVVRGTYAPLESPAVSRPGPRIPWFLILLLLLFFFFPRRRKRYRSYGHNGLMTAFLLSGLMGGRRGGFGRGGGGGGFGGGGGRFGGGGATGSW